MDKLDTLRLFVRIVERGSFVGAASDMQIPRSTATEAIKMLETRLKVRLLQRTTRVLSPTLDGAAFYQRCVRILAEIDEAEHAFSGALPSGLLRIDVHGAMARRLLLPHLPAFLARYPDLQLHIGEGDRWVDLVREGVDCVVRVGAPTDSGMIVRRLGQIPEATAASADYLARHGVPLTPDQLDGHAMVGFVSSRTGAVLPLEFTVDGRPRLVTLPARITVTGADTSAALACLGFGIIQAPRHRLDADFASGALVEILPAFAPPKTPISALYPHSRQLSPRVRVFVDWLVEIMGTAGDGPQRR